MARYQSLIVAALFRASLRFISPATGFSVRIFSSLLLSKTSLTLPRSSPFFYSISTFSSSSSSPSVRPPSHGDEEDPFEYKTTDNVEVIDKWEEEEEEVESQLGDGGDGGGIVLRGVPWGERVLSIAAEVLKQSEENFLLFAFRTSPRGYIYVRLDQLSNEYGCPTMDELEEFSREFKKRLDDAGAAKVVPDDLALEEKSVISRSREAAETPRRLTVIQGDANDSKLCRGNKLEESSEVCSVPLGVCRCRIRELCLEISRCEGEQRSRKQRQIVKPETKRPENQTAFHSSQEDKSLPGLVK